MDKRGLKERINQNINVDELARELLKPAHKTGYVCPGWNNEPCNNGTGKSGDGLVYYRDSNTLHCFKCGHSFRPIDLLVVAHGGDCTNDFEAALSDGADRLGIDRPGSTGTHTPPPRNPPKPVTPEKPATDVYAKQFSAFPLASACPDAVAYLESRKLTTESADRFGLRYNPRERKIIVPFWHLTGYTQKPIEGGIALCTKGCTVSPFNADALKTDQPVFVTEGWADAMSIEAAGFPALALNGAPNRKNFVNWLKQREAEGLTIPPLIAALDNDDAGRKANAELTAMCNDSGIYCYNPGNLYGDCKDANESYKCAPYFAESMRLAHDAAATRKTDAEREHEAEIRERRARLCADTAQGDYRETFLRRMQDAMHKPISTGFWNLDDMLKGGLRPGLYALGACTGAGKTTLALQIADHIASTGRPVLYVALEMSRDELTGKSISRISEIDAPEHGEMHGSTLDEVLDLSAWRTNTYHASKWYFKNVAPWMHILEGVGDLTVSDVKEHAEAIAEIRDVAPPVIFVDYLQILAPESDRLTDKQAADKNVFTLKRLSRDLCTPVFAISSFNRESYKIRTAKNDDEAADILQSAWKESGMIEYSCDWQGGMYSVGQYNDCDHIKLVMTKRRRLPPHQPIQFDMHGEVSYLAAVL